MKRCKIKKKRRLSAIAVLPIQPFDKFYTAENANLYLYITDTFRNLHKWDIHQHRGRSTTAPLKMERLAGKDSEQ